MKRLVLVVIIFLVICLIVSFKINNNNSNDYKIKESRSVEKRGVFISYIELGRYLKNKSVTDSKNEIDKMVNNIYNMGFNMIILQIRSFSDALYNSEIFPWSGVISSSEGVSPGYDILDYFIKCAHSKNISLYGWINPYRIRTNSDISSISEVNPAFKYIGTNTIYINNGIYYNPSKKEVEELIIDGVLEVVKNYDVDGILFDDYFYPDNLIDIVEYEEYIKKDYIEQDKYHLMIINDMVRKVHDVCRKYGKEFGISPDGNIENNYNKLYADVKKWGESNQYVDFFDTSGVLWFF